MSLLKYNYPIKFNNVIPTFLEKHFLWLICRTALKTMGEGRQRDQLESWSYTSQLVAEIESTQTQLLSTNYTRKHLRQFLLNIQKQNQASKL